jgi:hypothetical protein
VLRQPSAGVFADLVVDAATRDTPVVVVDDSATPVAVWATQHDDVRVDDAVAVPGGVWMAVTGIVRDERGEPLPGFSSTTSGLVFLQRSEVRR